MLRKIVFSGLLACIWFTPLEGQTADPEWEARRRAECRLAEQVLRTGNPHPHREWALAFISRCGHEGPVVLGALWRSVVPGQQIEPLVASSMELRDARLYEQLRQTSADRTRPAEVRVAAMLVLARYTDTRNAIGLGDLVPRDSSDWVPLELGWGTALRQNAGDVPLTQPIAVSVLRLFEEIAAARQTEPRAVWYAAAVLAKRLERDIRRGFAY